ncbi:Uncharacterized protein SCG7109_BE_00080 [Chlamydiales bacterium SCGC AG-110-M15]|nr:Uncharacterized protein SCG7109_BE_00080 [Chlamydiales bacterium SCGC AG-110-M15]
MDSDLHKKLKEQVEDSTVDENSCFILITCNEPKGDGSMHVEMSYEGDPILASYLLENAQNIIDEQTS